MQSVYQGDTHLGNLVVHTTVDQFTMPVPRRVWGQHIRPLGREWTHGEGQVVLVLADDQGRLGEVPATGCTICFGRTCAVAGCLAAVAPFVCSERSQPDCDGTTSFPRRLALSGEARCYYCGATLVEAEPAVTR